MKSVPRRQESQHESNHNVKDLFMAMVETERPVRNLCRNLQNIATQEEHKDLEAGWSSQSLIW